MPRSWRVVCENTNACAFRPRMFASLNQITLVSRKTFFLIYHQEDGDTATSGIEYMVPILGGLGREGVMAELPALLQVTSELFPECYLYLPPVQHAQSCLRAVSVDVDVDVDSWQQFDGTCLVLVLKTQSSPAGLIPPCFSRSCRCSVQWCLLCYNRGSAGQRRCGSSGVSAADAAC